MLLQRIVNNRVEKKANVWLQKCLLNICNFFFRAEDGIRDLVRSRGLGDVYERQALRDDDRHSPRAGWTAHDARVVRPTPVSYTHLTLPTIYSV